MIYTNSELVDYVKLSPNNSGLRNHIIDTIAIHCVVGQCSVETLGRVFSVKSKQASSNYGIGYDGKVGMYVEEKDRSWCTSSSEVDNRAVTIEVASDSYHPYRVNDVAYAKLILLVADICRRNNIKELKWQANKNLMGQIDKQNMVVHRWTSSKSCPGDYLFDKHYDIAKQVNNILSSESIPQQQFKKGDIVSITKGAYYYNNKAIVPDFVLKEQWILADVSLTSDRCILGKSVSGKYNIMSPISFKYLIKINDEVKDIIYVVKKGDALYSIALKYKINYIKLAEYNNIKPPYYVYINQKIKIPRQ